MRLILVAVLCCLAGCANLTPWYQQNYAGIASWNIEWCEGQPCRATVWDGKEKTDVQVTITKFPDGQVEFAYRALGVDNAELIKARAGVDVVQAAAVPGSAEVILEGVAPLLGVP